MNSYSEISEILDYDIVKELGFSKEQFNTLPFLYQNALINECIKAKLRDNKNVEEKTEDGIKKKILSIFNKK